MKLKILIVIICLFFKFIFAHNFETSVSVSPALSFLSNKSKDYIDNDVGFVFSFAIHEGYNFSDIFGIGIELEYMNSSHIFSNKYMGITIPETFRTYNHKLKMHTLNFPLLIKIETKKDESWYIQSGLGIIALLYSKRRIEIKETHLNSENIRIIVIEDEKTSLDRRYNYYYSVLIGKNFKIKKVRFFINIRYRSDIEKWKYELYDTQNNPETERYKIFNRFIALDLGLILIKSL